MKTLRWKIARWGAAAAILAMVGAGEYFVKQAKAKTEAPADLTAPSVPAARVIREDLSEVVTIPAEFRAYVETELRAKEAGYVGKLNVDFGDRVKEGQLLTTIEVPELQDELNNAIATEQRAEADYTNAHVLYGRLMAVNQQHPNLVAQQDIDNASAKDLTTAAAIAEAKTEVGRYRTIAGYTNITAPFDGVITRRYLDPGALVENRSDVLRVSDNYHLRLDFPVSLKYVKDIRVGDEIAVVVESLGGKKLSGKITRATWRVDDDTRTMTTELEVANPNLELVPGMYASVSFKALNHTQALAIPIEAVPPGQSPTVYAINAHNEIEERPVTLGIETPAAYEVVSGLREGDLIVLGSRSRLKPGEKVEPKVTELLAEK